MRTAFTGLRRLLTTPIGRGNGKEAKALTAMQHSGQSTSFFHALLPATNVDFKAEVGDGYGSSVLAAPLNWLMRTFPEATPLVERLTEEEWQEEKKHDLTELLRHPNPFYGGRTLWMATILDFAFGEAFWLKIRNEAGKVVQVWWVPRGTMEPKWPNDGKTFISHYNYRPLGGISSAEPIDVKDVVHFRFGIDPENTRRGFSPLGSLWREIATDDQAANFTASILRNLGIIGVVISPKEKSGGARKEDVQATKEYLKKHFTGDKRGEPLALGSPTDVNVMQYNLQGFDVSPIRDVSEERVCAALGIPAAVVGFGTGLHQTKVGAPQPLSARLWAPTGPTTMGVISEGDLVSTPSGWQPVQAVYPQGKQDIYRVTFQDGSTVECTKDHLWDVQPPNERRRIVLPLNEIAKYPFWKLRRTFVPLQGVTEFEEQPTLIPPYVMGLLLADGSFRANLFFANVNSEIVEHVRSEVAVGYDLTQTQPHNYLISYRDHARGRGIGNGSGDINPFKDEIRRLGLWNLYSHEKFIPECYKYNSSKVRRELLRGLLDGDGYVNLHGQPAIEQTSSRLARDVTEVVQSLGGYALQSLKRADRRVRFIKGHRFQSRHDRYHLTIVIEDGPSLFRCAEKRERCRRRTKPATRKFRSIDYVRQEEAQCIAVNGGLYSTDNFIVTHNTMKEMRQLAWTGCVIPLQEIIADECDRSLIPEFEGGDSHRLRFDASKLRALWEDDNEKHDRIRKDVLAGIITVKQAQQLLGYSIDDERDVYLQPVNLIQLPDGSLGSAAQQEGAPQNAE